MVLFNNVHMGQEVEAMWHNKIWLAKVMYTGRIDGFDGLWVGLQLKKPGCYTLYLMLIHINILCLPFYEYLENPRKRIQEYYLISLTGMYAGSES